MNRNEIYQWNKPDTERKLAYVLSYMWRQRFLRSLPKSRVVIAKNQRQSGGKVNEDSQYRSYKCIGISELILLLDTNDNIIW